MGYHVERWKKFYKDLKKERIDYATGLYLSCYGGDEEEVRKMVSESYNAYMRDCEMGVIDPEEVQWCNVERWDKYAYNGYIHSTTRFENAIGKVEFYKSKY